MPYMSSSPLAYPASSPSVCPSPKKRRKINDTREPLQDVEVNKTTKSVAGFLVDEQDSESDGGLMPMRKAVVGPRHEEDEIHPLDEVLQEELSQASCPVLELGTSRSPKQSCETDPLYGEQVKPALLSRNRILVRNSCGKTTSICRKPKASYEGYERLVAARSITAEGRATKSYYGIDIHRMIQEAENEKLIQQDELLSTASVSCEDTPMEGKQPARTLLWTEKYRAKKFTDLVGDERTHRSVLRWLKGWDSIVFPHQARPKARVRPSFDNDKTSEYEYVHRKVLLLTGPPGLGKTTLAHVCARQAGYEVQEINASDERSKDVVNGRIKDMVGTENVRSVDRQKTKKAARPICVVVDEVDGVIGGGGGNGEGGFIKALLDLLAADQRNTRFRGQQTPAVDASKKKRKGENFRLLRPVILICNDVYHPALRLLRQGTFVEIVHVRKPPLALIIPRLASIFEREGIPCDGDGVRQLCEATWGVTSRKESLSGDGTAEGDMRGILVIGEWVAGKLRHAQRSSEEPMRLTRRWIEENVLSDLSHGGGAARSLGRGGSRETVDRVFRHNAGFPTSTGPRSKSKNASTPVSNVDSAEVQALERLRHMVESSGEHDRIMIDCFSAYSTAPFQDDTILTKPNLAADWLHFHDTLSHRVHAQQEWELAPYLSYPVLAFHHLFAGANGASSSHLSPFAHDGSGISAEPPPHPLTTARAPVHAAETERACRASLASLHAGLSLPLHRSFRAHPELVRELLPYVLRILAPDVRPVVVGGRAEGGVASVRREGERALVDRAVSCMVATGIKFERGRVEAGDDEGRKEGLRQLPQPQQQGWIYRMKPEVDELAVFETMARDGGESTGKVRFAVRQVLQQAWTREVAKLEAEARTRRFEEGRRTSDVANGECDVVVGSVGVKRKRSAVEEVAGPEVKVKRDFFGRKVEVVEGSGLDKEKSGKEAREDRVWFTYHEGFSNAVRKGITLKELMDSL